VLDACPLYVAGSLHFGTHASDGLWLAVTVPIDRSVKGGAGR